MSGHFWLISSIFIDIVYKYIIWLPVDLIIHDWATDMLEVGSDLVESTCLWGGFDQADNAEYGVVAGFDCFVLSLGWVGVCDDSLAHVNPAELMFPESVKGLIDEA